MCTSIITVIILISQPWEDYLPNSFSSLSSSLGGSPVAFYDAAEYGAYNPAALTGIEKLSASVDYHFVSGEGYFWEDYKYSTSESFLDFFGLALPLNKKFYFGFFFSVPYNLRNTYPWEPEYTLPPQEDTTYFRVSYVNRFYSFSPSVGFKINEQLSVGLSLSGLIKAEKALLEYSGGVEEDYHSNKYNYGIEPCFGIQYREPAFSLGFTIKKGYTSAHHRNVLIYTYYGSSDTTESVEGGESTPLVLSGGINKCITDNFTLNFSVDYIGWKRLTCESEEGVRFTPENVNDVVSLHVGGEYRVNKNIALRMGAYNLPYTTIPYLGSGFDDLWGVGDKDQLFLSWGISLIKEPISFNFSFATSKLLARENSALNENQIYTSITFR